MKKIIVFIIIFWSYNLAAQNFQWAKNFESFGFHSCVSNNIKVDGNNNVFTIGYFDSISDFDPSAGIFNLYSPKNQSNIFISKLDVDGNFIWAKAMNGSSGAGNSLCIDNSQNIYSTGYMSGKIDFNPNSSQDTLTTNGFKDIFVSKLDQNGNHIWAKNIGGKSDDEGYSISSDGNNNVYISGFFSDTVDFNPGIGINTLISNGDKDIFILKLDPSGNFLWAKSIGGMNEEAARSIATDNLGNTYTGGYFNSYNIDLNPNAGVNISTTNGYSDAFIVKLDPNGNYVWSKTYGGTFYDLVSSIELDTFGNLFVTGSFCEVVDFNPPSSSDTITAYGTWDIYVLKLGTAGNYKWVKKLGGTGNDYEGGLSVDGDGSVYTTGNFEYVGDFDPSINTYYLTAVSGDSGDNDIFVSKLDSAGNFVWAKSFGSNLDYEFGYAIDNDNTGSCYTTGIYSATIDFDPNVGTYFITPNGYLNSFILKLGSSLISSYEDKTLNTDIKLFPNPNNGSFTIASKENMTLTVINNLGQMVQSIELNEGNYFQQNITINTSGVYYISGNTHKAAINQKIIVTK